MLPNNILQQVQTYNDAKLGYLLNMNCFIGSLNTKYKTFNDMPANLGDTINLEMPNRATVSRGLVANFQGVQQLLQPLVCDQAANSAHAFTSQQFIFNARDYMEKFGMARVQALGAEIESNVALNAISGVPVMTVNDQGQSVPTGALHTESGPYRFYGDGVTPINSFGQLAEIEAIFRDFGAAEGPLDIYLPNMAVTSIINTGLNQFVPDRNNKIANSWDLGGYTGGNARFYRSNLLPIHYAGTAGNNFDTLTLSAFNDPTGQNVTELTFTGVTVDAEAIKAGDLIQFDANTGLVYLTYIGYKPSQNLVQVRATADADATAGTVVVSITPSLQWQPGLNQNLNAPLVAGMTATALPTHRAGLVVGGKAFFLAMPPLDDQSPFVTATSTDPETKVSLRNYYGTQFGQNQKGYVTDCIWASTLRPDYGMRIVFPVLQQ